MRFQECYKIAPSGAEGSHAMPLAEFRCQLVPGHSDENDSPQTERF
jgi:hypothetical protein